MKMLVLATAYPSPETPILLMYIHTRNVYYHKNGFDVSVLNFAAKKSYEWEGIKVISLEDYKKCNNQYDILLVHAPNIRKHYFFLKKYQARFKRIVFFFHGHEVLYINKVYSKPYGYMKSNPIKNSIQNLYDQVKLNLWHGYLPKLAYKSNFIFVSSWMLNEFKKWVRLNEEDLHGRIAITYNGIGKNFENLKYDNNCEKTYDFVTIRADLDGSKYAVDIICKLAENYPQYNFLLVGRGKFFDYNKKPDNLCWKNEYCNHEQIIEYLNQSRCALMPTRTDAQGVMACEMATYGIPLITSDIEVCHEIFDEFENVKYINNDSPCKEFEDIYQKMNQMKELVRNKKYYSEETMKKELLLFQQILTQF